MKTRTIPNMRSLSLALMMTVGLGGCADLTLDQVVDVLGRRPPAGTQGAPTPPPSAPPTTTAGTPTPAPTSTPAPPTPAPPTTTAGAAIDELLGTWMNRDTNTRGMTKLVLTKVNDQQVGVHGFGKCTPSDCDWGAITTALSQPWTVGVYQFGFKQTRISFRRIGDELQVQTQDHYTDRSGRQDQSAQYTFVRTPGLHIRPGIFSAPRGFSPQ
jgi:hypothetical protein